MSKTKIKWRKGDRYAIEIYQDNAGEWRWRVRSRNCRILFVSSEGYKQRSNAKKSFGAVWRLYEAQLFHEIAYA